MHKEKEGSIFFKNWQWTEEKEWQIFSVKTKSRPFSPQRDLPKHYGKNNTRNICNSSNNFWIYSFIVFFYMTSIFFLISSMNYNILLKSLRYVKIMKIYHTRLYLKQWYYLNFFFVTHLYKLLWAGFHFVLLHFFLSTFDWLALLKLYQSSVS